MPSATTQRVKAQIPMIVEKLLEGKTTNQIAEEMGKDRTNIYHNLQRPEAQELMNHIATQRLGQHWDRIDELYQSENTQLKQTAIREAGAMIRAIIPKINLNRNESLNLTITEERRLFRIALDKMNPDEQREYLETYLDSNLGLEKATP